MNLGIKDGLDSNEKLVRFITESTDIEANMIFRVTVRDLSSFFNVPKSAAEFIKETLSAKKFKGRKIRIDDAEQRSGGGYSGGGRGDNNYKQGASGRSYSRKPEGSSYFGDPNRQEGSYRKTRERYSGDATSYKRQSGGRKKD
jgi:ATP-dependent RNA helicase DeaD